ncbi:putative cupin superfamily sugar epimerase [Allocatelliglobosispora scoriae]|uniref:Putative cupin superfamily sugar epimerase n=1 Tax=Allocatelliglobosispora scoriae TaxID=643052 RepID=A0A841BIU4_9ACTN|nr:cupin domain-containing protein [Allocatelliglobosispora scoriae]MBB5868184.1 putative cupin superfamily sugar epimerase [Allocatelliglobosispora scoriae]
MRSDDLIASLDLAPHPEGGCFRRVYTSPLSLGDRAAVTSIYYLMTSAQPEGRLHRNRSDILHYHLEGGPIDYLLLGPDGDLRHERLHADRRDLLVPGGCWKASRLPAGVTYALVAEVVTPGFDFADHEFGTEAALAGSPHLDELRPFLHP